MFAVVTTVELPEGSTIEEGRTTLEADVIPMIRQAPGFIAAYFLSPPEGYEGLSIVLFEQEDQARFASDNMNPPPPVKLIHTEVREVAASATA